MSVLRAHALLGLLILSISCIAHAATITFYNVAPTKTGEMPLPTASYSFHAIGVGADGATTYVEESVGSERLSWERTVYTSGETKVTTYTPVATLTGEPTTGTAIVVADATHYFYSTHIAHAQEDIIQDCVLNTATTSCEARMIRSGEGNGFTLTAVGPPVPFYTLVTSGGRGTKDSAGINRVSPFLVSGGVVVAGSLFEFFMVT